MGKTILVGLLVLAVFDVSRPHSGRAQGLDGWSLIHASSSYDYLVSLESIVVGQAAADAPPVRLFLGRMLTRHLDLERPAVISLREASGLSVDGYERYASTTQAVELRCAARVLRLGASTDFDEEGRVLAESPGDLRWRKASAYADSSAMNALLEWACDGR